MDIAWLACAALLGGLMAALTRGLQALEPRAGDASWAPPRGSTAWAPCSHAACWPTSCWRWSAPRSS